VTSYDGPAAPPPARSLLPSPSGLDVVDLGCGQGDFVRWAHDRGATTVLGLDLAVDVLDRARALGEPEGTRFEQADLDQLRLGFASYDLAWCEGLAHRVADPLRLARVVGAGLRPHGLYAAVVPRTARAAVVEVVETARLVLDDVREVAPGRDAEPRVAVLARKPAPGSWPRSGRAGPPPHLA